MFPDRPEYYDPEYGARIQARGDALREKIERSSFRPDDLLEDFDRLTVEYLKWARAQELREAVKRQRTLHLDDAGNVAGGAPDFEGDDDA